MISSTLGAPFGGTTVGGHQGFESLASSLITPSNFGGGGGSCLPSIVIVALGEPGAPVICCAVTGNEPSAANTTRMLDVVFICPASRTCPIWRLRSNVNFVYR